MWLSAIRPTRRSVMDRKSMNPGTAASRAPMTPAAIVYDATIFHVGPAHPARNTTSDTNEKIHSPIGSPTSIGWIGCPPTLAGVDITGSGRLPKGYLIVPLGRAVTERREHRR